MKLSVLSATLNEYDYFGQTNINIVDFASLYFHKKLIACKLKNN